MIQNSKMTCKLKANSVRTNLLIQASSELKNLKNLKLDCQTKINSRTLTNAESDFTKQNEQIVNLKSENFSNGYDNTLLRPIPMPLRKKCSFKSNDNLLNIDDISKRRDSSLALTPFIIGKSTKANTLGNNLGYIKLIDDKIELINTATGFSTNEKTRERTEEGFNYLKELTNKIINKEKRLNTTL